MMYVYTSQLHRQYCYKDFPSIEIPCLYKHVKLLVLLQIVAHHLKTIVVPSVLCESDVQWLCCSLLANCWSHLTHPLSNLNIKKGPLQATQYYSFDVTNIWAINVHVMVKRDWSSLWVHIWLVICSVNFTAMQHCNIWWNSDHCEMQHISSIVYQTCNRWWWYVFCMCASFIHLILKLYIQLYLQ